MSTIKRFIFGVGLLTLVLGGAYLSGAISSDNLPSYLKPYAQVLSQSEEDYLDIDCTPELCGGDVSQEDEFINTPDPDLEELLLPSCSEDIWECGSWTSCSATGTQTRSCNLVNDCKSATTPPPPQQQSCQPPTPPVKKPVSVKPAPAQTQRPAAEKPAAVESTETQDIDKALTEELVSLQVDEAVKAEEKAAEEYKTSVTETIEKNPLFKEVLEKSGVSASDIQADLEKQKDTNDNGIPDTLERRAGIDAGAERSRRARDELELARTRLKLVENGASEKEATEAVNRLAKELRGKRRVETIDTISEKLYGQKIENQLQDTNKDGISDQAAVLMGLDPKASADKDEGGFTSAERVLYGLDKVSIGNGGLNDPVDSEAIGNGGLNHPVDNAAIGNGGLNHPLSMGMSHGTRVEGRGFTVLAAGKPGERVTLFALDQEGNEIALQTNTMSENGRAVFGPEPQLEPGRYVMQVRGVERRVSSFENLLKASTLAQLTKESPKRSRAVLVEVVDKTDVAEPIVETIQNVNLTNLLRDIKVKTDSAGRITVTGRADIASTVIGNFQSAVFTSAILADVTTGSFQLTSSEPLPDGDHEVLLYATLPENNAQSKPVRVSFSIIETAQAADGESGRVITNQSTPESSEVSADFPLIPVATGVGIGLLVLVGYLLHKRKLGE